MIPVVLQQLERLRRELAAIDPSRDIDAAARVAAIASALRREDRVKAAAAKPSPARRRVA